MKLSLDKIISTFQNRLKEEAFSKDDSLIVILRRFGDEWDVLQGIIDLQDNHFQSTISTIQFQLETYRTKEQKYDFLESRIKVEQAYWENPLNAQIMQVFNSPISQLMEWMTKGMHILSMMKHSQEDILAILEEMFGIIADEEQVRESEMFQEIESLFKEFRSPLELNSLSIKPNKELDESEVERLAKRGIFMIFSFGRKRDYLDELFELQTQIEDGKTPEGYTARKTKIEDIKGIGLGREIPDRKNRDGSTILTLDQKIILDQFLTKEGVILDKDSGAQIKDLAYANWLQTGFKPRTYQDSFSSHKTYPKDSDLIQVKKILKKVITSIDNTISR